MNKIKNNGIKKGYIFQYDNSWIISNTKSKKNLIKICKTRNAAIKSAGENNISYIFIKNTNENKVSHKAKIEKLKKEIKEIQKHKKDFFKKEKKLFKNTVKNNKANEYLLKEKYESKISEFTSKNNKKIRDLNDKIGDLKKYSNANWIKTYSSETNESYFSEERTKFHIISWIMTSVVALFNIYFIITIILPFLGEYWLIYHFQYFGWPIWATLFLVVWVPALFISLNLYSKRKLTDFQLILERRKIVIGAMILALPSLGTSLLLIAFVTSNLYNTKEFKEFVRKNPTNEGSVWLKDESPIDSKTAGSLGFAWLIIISWGLIIIFPIYKLIKETFNGELGVRLGSSTSYKFSFKHFQRLFDQYNYLDWMWNTLFISIITMIIIVVLATFASYIYSRNRFKSKKTTLMLVMVLGLMPSTAAIVAYYILSVILKGTVGLDGRWLLIFLYSGGGVVGSIFNLKGYLDGISTELDDAAVIDGASKLKVYFKIIFPLMKPMIPVIAIGAFVGPFGDYIMPQILFKDAHNWTLAQGLQHMQTLDETAFAAGAILIAVPITIVISISQRLMVKDTTRGGVKG